MTTSRPREGGTAVSQTIGWGHLTAPRSSRGLVDLAPLLGFFGGWEKGGESVWVDLFDAKGFVLADLVSGQIAEHGPVVECPVSSETSPRIGSESLPECQHFGQAINETSAAQAERTVALYGLAEASQVVPDRWPHRTHHLPTNKCE